VVGLDVTVDGDAGLDFKWSNPTPNPVLIQSRVEGDQVIFSLYGRQPTWKVEVEPAKPTNTRPADPTPVKQEEPSLPAGKTLVVEAARDGFDAEVKRVVTSPDAAQPRVLDLKTSYQPSRNVTLVGTGHAG
jgi:vancomycin resistance protein YoaR